MTLSPYQNNVKLFLYVWLCVTSALFFFFFFKLGKVFPCLLEGADVLFCTVVFAVPLISTKGMLGRFFKNH